MMSRVLALKVYVLNLMTLRNLLISTVMHFDKLMRGYLFQIVTMHEGFVTLTTVVDLTKLKTDQLRPV
jgi:hypothetical protein